MDERRRYVVIVAYRQRKARKCRTKECWGIQRSLPGLHAERAQQGTAKECVQVEQGIELKDIE